AGLRVEARDLVVDHRAGPGFLVLVEGDVVGRRPARPDRPVPELAGLRVEHADLVAAVLREPEAILRVHLAAPRRGDRGAGRHLVELDLARSGVDAADVALAEIGEPGIVLRVGDDVV